MNDLIVVFIIGLFGSAHCIGMCGGFVVAMGQLHGGSGRARAMQSLYYVGKTMTYTVFGAVAGAFGAAVGAAIGGVQDALSIALGIVIVLIGLSLAGVFSRLRALPTVPGVQALSGAIGKLLQRRSGASLFALGALNGLLPCGLVYALLVKAAATGSVVGGAATMAVFGLATVPALYILSLSSGLMRPLWRNRLSRIGGVLVVVLGLLTIARGTPARPAVMGLLHGTGGNQEQSGTRPPEQDAPARSF